ncbi:GntR family transcriptional regulator [Candidatus Cyanaurora vandensis]|uniref:GntR family transcriptional regulator n=2 Tax=Candidatus Cyanaurora vandensis TaxID=2714958 RepID=UPI00257B62B9|nr:GntR family transcriptional regulator [Candidatus Cyanaurora vandensis]
MVRFRISTESPVPPSAQLYEQLSFAIASRQLPPGARLPSVRQLSMQTGLHRNTISKVYNQLVGVGMVQARAGSGVYVLDNENATKVSTIQNLVRRTLETALAQGYTLRQVREVVEVELDRRLRDNARILVTSADSGSLAMIVQELEDALCVPVQGVHLWELTQHLATTQAGLIVTQRYDLSKVRQTLNGFRGEVIPLDIYSYQREIELVEQLSAGSTLGLVSLSPGILRIAEIIVQSIRGQNLLVLTAQLEDTYALMGILRTADLVIVDETSYRQLEQQVKNARLDRLRPLRLHRVANYITKDSIAALRRHLHTEP